MGYLGPNLDIRGLDLGDGDDGDGGDDDDGNDGDDGGPSLFFPGSLCCRQHLLKSEAGLHIFGQPLPGTSPGVFTIFLIHTKQISRWLIIT